jgi:hypothetical protein
MIVKLTKEELDEADYLAHARNDPKVHLNKYSWSKEGTTSFDNHYWGLKCEIAVAKILGIEIDKTIHDGDDQNPDLYYKGIGIEVKGRTKKGWDFALLKDDIKQFKADVGVLCWPGDADNEIEVVGFITREKFSHVAVTKNYKYGNRLVAEAKHFTPLTKKGLEEGNELPFVLNPKKGTIRDLSALLTATFKTVEKDNVTKWEKVVQLEESGHKYKLTLERMDK